MRLRAPPRKLSCILTVVAIGVRRSGSSTTWGNHPDPVTFDIIGESYYPWWHGDLNALSNCLNNAAQHYNKPVIVAETAFPWTNSVPASFNPNLGIPLTPAARSNIPLH